VILSALTDQQLQSSEYLSGVSDAFKTSETLGDIHAKVKTATTEKLLSLKFQFALSFAQTDFSSFDEMGRVWSSFADATLDRAIELAWSDAAKQHRLKLPNGKIPGLFLLGLGKLGGHDLNFSSDVDLIAFFDTDILPVPEHKGQAYIASDICKRVTQILQPRNSPEFVWRVDWRLRPESSGNGLAMSTAKAETFYFFRSLPWHRLALMKARVVAGDKQCGLEFLTRLEPYIWRRNLDFTTLDELAALKTRINNEHPGLQKERAAPEPITPLAAGFNLKLGRGGIREIEFIANAQQLIHGGKRPALRVTHTRTALSQLGHTELMSSAETEALRDDYSYFRQVENAVQMLGNEQTHIVPTGEGLKLLLTLLGHPSDFDHVIFKRRKRVHQRFSALFADVASSNKTDHRLAIDTSSLTGSSNQIANSWINGFQDHGLSQSNQNKYRGLGQRLTERVQSRHREDQAFERVDTFLKQIGRSEPYFALLNRHPNLLEKLITPLLHSPHMSEILRQSPHIIDIFIAANDGTLKEQSSFVLTSPDYEHRLEALRRFVNEQLFLSYSKFIDGSQTVKILQSKLTALAEQTLNLSIQIVTEDLGLHEIPVTVLGLGKMGTQAMAPKSDLDLMFLFADDVDSEVAGKIVQRLRTTLTVKLREGIAYELDMRLRPSGRSGPPAVKLSSFKDHHMKRAHSWEHIALAPARIVAGDAALGKEVMAIKSEIFDRPRDEHAFKEDAFAMFQRLASERLHATPANVWRTKLRTGGLMEADYMRSCMAVLGDTTSPQHRASIEIWNGLQIWERLLGLTGKTVMETPSRFIELIHAAKLEKQQSELESSINTITNEFFAEVDKTKTTNPRAIMWRNSG